MGAWGEGHFDNDDALDWVYELEEAEDTEILMTTLTAVTTTEYVEAPEACAALAAAEVVAALVGNPADDLPPEVSNWVEEHDGDIDDDLVDAARGAVKRVRTDSELQELWEETEDADSWQESIDDLLKRIDAD